MVQCLAKWRSGFNKSEGGTGGKKAAREGRKRIMGRGEEGVREGEERRRREGERAAPGTSWT